jgi:tRNA A-37 threonylcarbamoyl transferase component Bud32
MTDLQIPGYQIIRPIAEGGMASVYLAIQESLQRQVALKLLRQFDNPVHASRFHNEGLLIASLNHRNVITIHDIGVTGERYYLAMEYLENGDLEKRICTGMRPDAALELVETLGSCLDFLHRQGIIHRDIKPANILFRKDGTPVLTDFGIAKQLDLDIRLTIDNTALGSPHYLSPEQAECKPVDGRTDIYGLGIIFYEMLTGRKPFQGDSPIEAILAHLTMPVPSLPTELSAYQELLERMIAKAPEGRYQTAGDMVTAIRKLQVRRRGNIPPVTLTAAIHKACNVSLLKQGRKFGQQASLLIVDALKQVWSKHLRTAWSGIKRTFIDHLPGNTRLRRMVAALPVVLVVSLAAGGFLSKPTARAAKEHVVQVAPSEPTTAPVVLRLSEGVAIRRENNLRRARQALEEYRLTTPEGNNAWYYYQRVLEENPNNTEALAGTKQIANIYADLAVRALDRLHYRMARGYIERGLRVDPNNERLSKLKDTNGVSYTATRALERVKSLFR